jgi:hypothetical protein
MAIRIGFTLHENFLVFRVFRKMSKNLKKPAKKKFNFFLFRRFYAGGKNFTNKKGLFYANFFEFEVKS